MPQRTDPAQAPAYVLNTLNAAGYEPYHVDGEPDLWRLPGLPPRTWKQCMEDVGVESATLRAKVVTMQHVIDGLRDEILALKDTVAKLMAATPKSGFLSSEFILSILTALPMVAGAIFMMISENAAVWFPPPWNQVIAGVCAILGTTIVKGYTTKRTELKEQSADAKKQIADDKKAADEKKP